MKITRAILTAALLCAPALGGCSSDTSPPAPAADAGAAPVRLDAGAVSLRIDTATGEMKLFRDEVMILDLPADAIQLGTVTAIDDLTNYDPFPIFAPTALHMPPDDLTWLSPTSIAVASPGDPVLGEPLTLSLTFAKGKTATLQINASSPGSILFKLTPDAAGEGEVAYLRLRPRPAADEAFYGLGEHFDDVNQRGKIRAMQIERYGNSESGYNDVHVPIPFIIGTRGWGLFVQSYYPGVFAVTADGSDRVDAVFGTGAASRQGIFFYLFGEERPLDVTRHYYEATGYPRLPASWALGPWVWRDENKDQAQAEADLQAMRDLDLPATGYWVDRPYATAVNTFDWNPAQFPDPQALIDKAHDLGFAVALWHTPYIDKKDPATAALRDEAEAHGYYPPVTGLPLNPWGRPIDFTNPGAYLWWTAHVTQYTLQGIEGFKLDYAEDVVPGLNAGRNVWEFRDGSDERTMHAAYQIFYHQVYASLLPPAGGFLLCRHATWGEQDINAPIIWPGDLDASFAKAGETTSDQNGKSYVAVGGLPASVVAGLSLGPSGFPFFGADTGGYIHSPPDKELFTRWFEQTALSPVMQIGNSGSTVAWEPDPETGFDEEMLGWYRTYTRLHLRLFPYEWTLARAIARDGRPITRPLGLVYPEMGEHPNDVYLFGDALLVAPVVARGVTARPVPMPPGKWIDFWTGAVVEGNKTIMADAPLEKLPLWIAEGGIIPMLRPTIDTTRATTKPSLVDSYVTDPGVLWARVAPGAPSRFTVYDGAELSAERAADRVKLGAKSGKEYTHGVVFEVIAQGKKPAQVTDGGSPIPEAGTLDVLEKAPAGWFWSSDTGGTVYVKAPAGPRQLEILP